MNTKEAHDSNSLGIVIIGRNEGERLKRCINSVTNATSAIVYVDSGSTDGSAEWCRDHNIQVVELDLSRPFTAARARNEGFSCLTKLNPNLRYVQFIDGDCEVQPEWLNIAIDYLDQNSHIAIACGRRRERWPESSIYNQLCDIEWNTPIGEARACGGDSLMRTSVLKEENGFRGDVIAGEEPELCFRVRSAGHQIWRLDEEMTLHDAAITTFSQWWKRAQRAGYAYILGASIHGSSEEKFRVRECLRILVWGGLIPISTLLLLIISPIAILITAIYPMQWFRLYSKGALPQAVSKKTRAYWALFTVIGKFPEFAGMLQFSKNTFTKKQARIIEYK